MLYKFFIRIYFIFSGIYSLELANIFLLILQFFINSFFFSNLSLLRCQFYFFSSHHSLLACFLLSSNDLIFSFLIDIHECKCIFDVVEFYVMIQRSISSKTWSMINLQNYRLGLIIY